jgi:hypothetical protein
MMMMMIIIIITTIIIHVNLYVQWIYTIYLENHPGQSLTPVMTLNLPEEVYCMDIKWPMMAVGEGRLISTVTYPYGHKVAHDGGWWGKINKYCNLPLWT